MAQIVGHKTPPHTHTLGTIVSTPRPSHSLPWLCSSAGHIKVAETNLTSPSAPSHNIHALAHTTTYTHVVPKGLGSHSSRAIEALGANANPDNENNGKGGTVVGFAEVIKIITTVQGQASPSPTPVLTSTFRTGAASASVWIKSFGLPSGPLSSK